MSNTPQDPRIPKLFKHLRILARRHARAITVQDYRAYRAKTDQTLPSVPAIYRWFDSWEEVLDAADLNAATERSRMTDEALVEAVRLVAREKGVSNLSSHQYDAFREQYNKDRPQPERLPSSSVIRKRLGHWREAMVLAGLDTTDRTAVYRPSLTDVIERLRDAKREVDGMLTPQRYTELVATKSDVERERWPDVTAILTQFNTWELALSAADIEQSDHIHPDALWTAEEARQIARNCERVTNKPLSRESYQWLRRQSSRPLPTWKVLSELLEH